MSRSVALLATLVSILATSSADACKCRPPPPPQEALEQAAAVFVGKVTKIENVERGIVATFEVSQSWKGVKAMSITVRTAADSAACGFGFEMDKEYVVYAQLRDEQLMTNLCTRTRALDGIDMSEVEALGEPEKMPPAEVPVEEKP